jgi:hypothetical protein
MTKIYFVQEVKESEEERFGTGCVFAVFSDEEPAKKFAESIDAHVSWRSIFITEPLLARGFNK